MSVRASSLSTRQRFRRAALRDQEVGIGDRGVGVGTELEDAAVGGVGGRGAAVALLELGQRRRQPAARRRRQAARRQHRLEAAPRGCGLAAQRRVLGQARRLVDLGAGATTSRHAASESA